MGFIIERYERILSFAKALIKYKNSVLERMKEKIDYKLRFPVTNKYSKKPKLWLEEDKIEDFRVIYRNDVLLACLNSTKAPNELLFEVDIKDPEMASFYTNAIKVLLEERGIPFWAMFSGGKSIHIHIYIKPDGLTLSQLEARKNYLYEEVKKILDTLASTLGVYHELDHFGKSMNHPFRIPWGYHPETGEMAIVLRPFEWNNYSPKEIEEKIPQELKNMEKEVFVPLKVKPKKLQYYPKKPVKINKESKLYKLYDAILSTIWEDGKHTLLLILFAIAKKIGIPPEKFREDTLQWLDAHDMKPSQRRNHEYNIEWFVKNWDLKDYPLWKYIKEMANFNNEEISQRFREILKRIGLSKVIEK